MAITTINDWLRTNGGFALGLDLLRLHGSITYRQNLLFRDGETGPARRELVAALKAVNEQHVVPDPDVPVVTVTRRENYQQDEKVFRKSLHKEPLFDVPIEALPPEMQAIRKELTALHRQRTFLRGKLTATPDGPHLRELAAQILDLRLRIKAGLTALEMYRTTGQSLPPDPDKGVKSPSELKLKLQQLRVYINRVDKGHRKAKPGVYEGWVAEKIAIEALLHEPVEA